MQHIDRLGELESECKIQTQAKLINVLEIMIGDILGEDVIYNWNRTWVGRLSR